MASLTEAPSIETHDVTFDEAEEVYRAVFAHYAVVFRAISRDAPPEVAYPPVVWVGEYVNDALRLGHAANREFANCLAAAYPVLTRFDAVWDKRMVFRSKDARPFEDAVRAKEDAVRQRDLAYARVAKAKHALEKARAEEAEAKKRLQDLQDDQDVQD